MFNIFQSNWYVAICATFAFFISACVIIRVLGSHRFRSDGQHAHERLRKFERGEPPKLEAV